MKVQYKVYHEYVVLKFWGKLEGEGKIARILRIFFFFFHMIFLWNGVYYTYIDIEPQVLCIFCSLFRTPSSNFAFLHSHVSTLPVFFTSLKLFVHQVPAKMLLLQEAFLSLSLAASTAP